MLSFGYSAFVRLLSLDANLLKREVRKRLSPIKRGGYDPNSSFRRLAHRYVVGGQALAEVLSSATNINRMPERLSTLSALKRLNDWRQINHGNTVAIQPTIYKSPRGLFKVRLAADFGLQIAGSMTAIHLWNTKNTILNPEAAYAALELMEQVFGGQSDAPKDFGILSMQNPLRLYRLSDVTGYSEFAEEAVDKLENIIRGEMPSPAPAEPHPSM